ncbi:hypothetical protein AAVH_29069 [Aphelenchoides avenae]|nr:hypothetical protein AAVH_29069 [Aphelenchus avenae]
MQPEKPRASFVSTDGHHIASLVVIYKRSLVTPGCGFLSTLFAEARKRSLRRLKVSLASVEAKNCDIELQVGFQVLSEILQDQERPSAEHLTVVVSHLKRFGLLHRIQEAYARGEITRPLTIGCDSSISMAELLPDTVFLFLIGKELSAEGRKQATMTVTFIGGTTFYKFSLPC